MERCRFLLDTTNIKTKRDNGRLLCPLAFQLKRKGKQAAARLKLSENYKNRDASYKTGIAMALSQLPARNTLFCICTGKNMI